MLEDCLPISAIETLSAQESGDLLMLTSLEEFVGFMRRTLPPEEAAVLTDSQLRALHQAMCERLQAKAGMALDLWESSRPAGQG
jgi:hypothetical protein